MPTVPRTVMEQIDYFQGQAKSWAKHPDAIGLTAERVAVLAGLADAAREALQRQAAAHSHARATTQGLKDALKALHSEGSKAIQLIRARAAVDGNGVSAQANLPPIAPRSKLGAPGTPYSMKWAVTSVGWVQLTWECDNPRGTRGTVYQVYRQLNGAGGFEFIGASGDKRFDDDSVPPGTREVEYRVQAVRSTAKGNPGGCTVYLGSVMRQSEGATTMRVRGDRMNAAA